MFARRTGWNLELNPLAQALAEAHARGQELLDLTSTNPTACGLNYAMERIARALADPRSLQYEPAAFGIEEARRAVAEYAHADWRRVFLTASTSEAYSFLMRLLCEPGDQWLVPRPSYPLFEVLAQVQDVELVPYELFYDDGWHIDLHTVERAASERARALVVVNPNNPTGNYVGESELRELERMCAEREIALVADEVFLDFALEGEARLRSCVGRRSCLAFVLSGLSKTAALPQMKLAWTVVEGPAEMVEPALQRLEMIADAYLSVGAPVQNAVQELLATATDMQRQIVARCRENVELLREMTAGTAATLLRADGGWSGILRVPMRQTDEQLALALLQEHGVVVHPGHFYDFVRDGFLVLSLLTPPQGMREGMARILRATERTGL